ncbi:MAG: hypothetical protein K2W82_02415 [Candidatus Obscuribacterales bacterium]|nr:hypothetical protein [Candidatus Obscuribacterales bacterium]
MNEHVMSAVLTNQIGYVPQPNVEVTIIADEPVNLERVAYFRDYSSYDSLLQALLGKVKNLHSYLVDKAE